MKCTEKDVLIFGRTPIWIRECHSNILKSHIDKLCPKIIVCTGLLMERGEVECVDGVVGAGVIAVVVGYGAAGNKKMMSLAVS